MPPSAATADAPTIGDLLDLPRQVFRGDFVLNLAEGVTRPDEMLRQYVVTPQLVECFDNALTFIRSALETRTSRAAYLHGSFGAGKSHFMAVLDLLLDNYPGARSIDDLAKVVVKHPWTAGKKFLLVPYHLIGARNLESAILGGYVRHIEQHRPDAPLPGVFAAEELFENAERLRRMMGDARFLAELGQEEPDPKWQGLDQGWTLETYQAALRAPAGSEERARLVGDLVKTILPSFRHVADLAASGQSGPRTRRTATSAKSTSISTRG